MVSEKLSENNIKDQATELADLMSEFGLKCAKLSGEDWSIEFAISEPTKSCAVIGISSVQVQDSTSFGASGNKEAKVPKPQPEPKGTPISSPMMGVFYSSPSPGSPNFCKEGDSVNAGDVVGLIEAMKVFNEIVSPVSGTILKIVAGNGALVQPGEPLVLVG